MLIVDEGDVLAEGSSNHVDQRLDQTDELWQPGRVRRLRALALAETSAAFISSGSSSQAALQTVASRIANRLECGCLIRPEPGSGSKVPTAAGHARWRSQDALMALVRTSPAALGSAYCAWVAERGRSILTPETSSKVMRLWSDAAARLYLDECDISSFLVVPLRSTTQVIGTVALWRERPGLPFDERDRLFAEEVGRRLILR